MERIAFKKTRLVGESATGIEDAIRAALETSASRVHGQTWCEVKDIRTSLDGQGAIDRWQVEVEVAFKVDD